MFAFTRNTSRRPGASAALALALMCGSALGMVALEAPAAAQKKKKEDTSGKPNYSKGFIAAYTAAEALTKSGDNQGAKAQVPTVLAAIETDDDRNAAGGLVFNLGAALSDQALQMQGVEMMIASGKTDPAKLGQFNYIAYQLASQAGNAESARKYLASAIDLGHTFEGKLTDGTTRTFGPDDMRGMMAETYFDAENYAGGFDYLRQQIAQRVAAGQPVPQSWITRGLSVAYTNGQADSAVEFGTLFVKHFPSDTSWGDAIAIQRNMVDYDAQHTLDLLRLAARTNALRDTRSYVDYIEAADPRRLPGEVKRVVEAGVSSGKLTSGDVFVNEASTIANARIAADRADMPALERDAMKPGSTALTATAAGDAFLSYQDWAKAEAMYSIAATKPGADLGRVLTRLGIAQAEQGKTAEAIETFAKVDGSRKNIADLWTLYTQQKSAPAT